MCVGLWRKTAPALALFLVCALACPLWAAPAATPEAGAPPRTPLLQAGKRTLYQRVISHPGARLSVAPGAPAAESVPAFTPFYVYARQQAGGQEWLEVSPASNGRDMRGWLKASESAPWDKALTLMFADRMGRDPVMFFRRFEDLNTLVSTGNMRAALDRLFAAGKDANSPLLATEPQDVSVPREQFYLMPVFGYSDEYEKYNLRLLNVGIINPGAMPKAAPAPVQPVAPPPRYTAGVAFIVDTTISMKPYIQRFKMFLRSAYDALNASDIADDVSFGVVAYRNSTKHNPRLEYVATVVTPFAPVKARQAAEERVAGLDEARVPTHAFNEDAFAGIKEAVDKLDWSPHAVKMAVLVTDAGAIRTDDPLSSTGFSEREMADLLAQKGIRLVVIHLHTALGKKHNLPGTIEQYKTLTAVRDGRVKSTYVPMSVGRDAASASQQFGRIAEALVGTLKKIIQQVAAGQAVAKPVEQVEQKEATPEETAAWLGQCLGYAAWLDFAGRREQTTAPQLEAAWVADKDLNDLVQEKSTAALVPAVLLNKHQLNSLAQQIGVLVDAVRAARVADSTSLFQRVLSLSTQIVRDPQRLLGGGAAENLAQTGQLPEFLEGLPYHSEVMKLTEARWQAMSAREQDELINSLEAKLRLYQEYHNDTANWMSFGATDPAEALYRVPLSSLP